jgi:hypothetical protein
MQRNCRVACSVLSTLALAAFLAGCKEPPYRPKTAADINRGVDVFQTSTGKPTSIRFASHPIPADFFCPGSPPFNGEIQLSGIPLATEPAGVAANGDTLVERLEGAPFGAKIPVKVRALRLTSASPLKIACASGDTDWRADVCACGEQPTTHIVAKVDQPCGCGHFDGALKIKICLRFTEVPGGKVLGPLKQEVNLKIADMPWCPKPGQGEPVIGQPFRVDTGCEGKPDFDNVPGTSNFFPGWTCDLQVPGVDCLTKYASLTHCHDDSSGPVGNNKHCVNPICGRKD